MSARCDCLWESKLDGRCCYWHLKVAAGVASPLNEWAVTLGVDGEPSPEQLRFVGVDPDAPVREPQSWLDHWELMNRPEVES